METTTPTVKQRTKEHIKSQFNLTEIKAKKFKDEKDKEEKIWRDYFDDIKKHSNNFELTSTPMKETFKVYAYSVDENGELLYSLGSVIVGEIVKEYNTMSIKYIGQLPPNTSSWLVPKVYIEEHITYGRRGFGRTNHGYKLRVEDNFGKQKYYKTGKKIVEIVEEYVESKWDDHKRNLKFQDIKARAAEILKERYKYSIISFSDGVYTIKHLNGISVSVGYREDEKGEVVFDLKKVHLDPKQHDVNKIIEELGKL